MDKIGTTYTGAEFNEIYAGVTFCTTVTDGNDEYFLARDFYNYGGYFHREYNWYEKWTIQYCDLCLVEVSDYYDVKIYDINKFGCNAVYVRNLIRFKEMPEEYYIQLVEYNGLNLEHIPHIKQNEKICEAAVKQNGYALEFIEKQTDKIRDLAIQQNPMAKQFIK